MDNEHGRARLREALRRHLQLAESDFVEALQRLLFVVEGLDVRRSEIARVFADVFAAYTARPPSDERRDVPPAPRPRDQVSPAPPEPAVRAAHDARDATPPQEDTITSLADALRNPGILLTARRPAVLHLPDGTTADVRSWRTLVEAALAWLAANYPCPPLPCSRRPGGRNYFLSAAPRHAHSAMTTPVTMTWAGKQLFVEANQSALNFMRALAELVAVVGVPLSSFGVAYADGHPASDGESVQPRNVALRIAQALRALGAPRHYGEIAGKLQEMDAGAPIRLTTVRATLGEYKDLFAGLGNGVYGLTEWGLKGQTNGRGGEPLADLIQRILTERDQPLRVEDIVTGVLRTRQAKESSVRGCLARDARFHPFGNGTYGLKRWVM